MKRTFCELPVRLYEGNPVKDTSFDNDIRNVFDPAKNPCFQNGECIRWILKDEAGAMCRESSCFYQSENLSSGQI